MEISEDELWAALNAYNDARTTGEEYADMAAMRAALEAFLSARAAAGKEESGK